jgi:periplasmic protein TonB
MAKKRKQNCCRNADNNGHIPMFESAARKSETGWWVGCSLLLHAALLIVLVHTGHDIRVRAFLPGTPQGAHIDLSYLPGGAPPPAPSVVRKHAPAVARESRLALPAKPMPTAAPPSETATSSHAATSASSNDALGSEDIQIALTTYSPSPKPDLSRLPHGAQGEVVVDVTIDPTGQVADLQILATLGYGIDDAVSQTVRTWRFTPATRDGVAVASVQELHFHYGPV